MSVDEGSKLGLVRPNCVARAFLLGVALVLAFIGPCLARTGEPAAVVVGDRVVFLLKADVAGISPAERAALVNRRIERILTDHSMDPQDLHTREASDGSVLIELDSYRLLGVTPGDAAAEGTTSSELAQQWVDLLEDVLTTVKPIYRPPETRHVSFMPLLLVSLLAYVVPLLAMRFTRFPVPVVVGEIVVGILIGRSGLGLVHYSSWLQFLAEFGLAFLMFLSGLEIDFTLLKGRSDRGGTAGSWRRSPVVLGIASFSIALTLGGIVSLWLAAQGLVRQPLMMALILSTAALGLVVPVLKERALIGSLFGQTLLMAALIADFVSMFLITIVAGWVSRGPTLKLLLGLVLIAAFVVSWKVAGAFLRLRRGPRPAGAQTTSQVNVRGSLALMLIFVALSEQLGTEAILGAFLSGVLLSLLTGSKGSDLHEKLEALGFGFFIPIFFIMVGVRFDLQSLIAAPQGLLLAPILVAASFVIQLASALPLRFIASWREILAGAFLLSSRLSLTIAAAEVSLRLGLISRTVNGAVICLVLVTCLVAPVGFNLLMPVTSRRQRRTLVVGAGEHGRLLAGRLQSQGWGVAMLEREAGVVETARLQGFTVFEGDGSDAEALREAGLEKVQVLVAASSSDEANEAACMEAARCGVPRRIALVHRSEVAERLQKEGVALVSPMLSTVVVLEGLVTHPSVFEMLTGLTGDTRVAEILLTNTAVAGQALRDIQWPGDVLVLSVRRGGEVLVPHGATLLQTGDTLTLIGSEHYVCEEVARLGG